MAGDKRHEFIAASFAWMERLASASKHFSAHELKNF
jgi:hypothetical protein